MTGELWGVNFPSSDQLPYTRVYDGQKKEEMNFYKQKSHNKYNVQKMSV